MTTSTSDDPVTELPNGFAALGASPESVRALEAMGITQPFPVQRLTLQIALSGADVIGQARTGTGKTLAFGVPLLDRLTLPSERPQALVVVPTRELCIQVADDLHRAGSTRGVKVVAIYGGRAFEPQVDALRAGVDVVVGTPGRLLDLARQGHLDLGGVRTLVLDEADEMLDLGFLPDIEKILAQTPPDRQTMLFSATMPGPILTLARRFLNQPVHMRAEDPTETSMVPTTAQHVFRAHSLDKVEMIARILQSEGRGLTIVFCRTKRGCDRVGSDLADRGFAAAAVHGDLAQAARERVVRAFRSGKIDVLVATDVAARGIDIQGVTHVVNYQCPEDDKTYVHRIGRTGRAGETGIAVTLVDWDDMPRWKEINDTLGLPFPEPPETYSSSAHFYEALDIPKGVTGTLPRRERTRVGLQAEELEDIGDTGSARRRRTEDTSTRGPRDHRPAERRAPAAEPDAARPPRARARRRTRSGVPGETAPAAPAAHTSHPAAAQSGGDGGAEATRSRRRRRGGSGRGRSAADGADGTPATGGAGGTGGADSPAS
ncbi:MAG TPA: DEAD/DEAH box helicase [Mycobacteriales bacterium]|nr:DEAD/DEAH box helicase [Mycobacteriales bacterium]